MKRANRARNILQVYSFLSEGSEKKFGGDSPQSLYRADPTPIPDANGYLVEPLLRSKARLLGSVPRRQRLVSNTLAA